VSELDSGKETWEIGSCISNLWFHSRWSQRDLPSWQQEQEKKTWTQDEGVRNKREGDWKETETEKQT
jgi:hypothetical protein